MLRALLRSPRYALIAGSIIAVGLGACTTVFSIFDSLILRDRLGVVDSATLVDVGRSRNGAGFDNLAFADYADLRDSSRTISDLAALRLNLTGAGLVIDREAETARGQWVTPNFLRVLGTKLALGRDFSPGETPAAEIILSHRYWQSRFRGDPGVIGRTIVFNRVTVAVIGVTEPGFVGNTISAADFWAPVSLQTLVNPASTLLKDRGSVAFLAVGRLAPGATVGQARAEAALIARRLETAYPETNRGRGLVVHASSRLPGEFGEIGGTFLTLLGALTGLALVVASTNIGGLMLARSALRRRELAVRAALGAERRQLIRLLLGEHLAVFAAGAAGGVLIAAWLVALLRFALAQSPLPVTLEITLSPWGALFALLVSVLAGLACGLGPALRGTRFDLLPALRAGEQPAGSRFFSLRNLFLTVQLTVALALLVTAGLLTQSLRRLAATHTGYTLARIEAASLDVSIIGLADADAHAFRDALLARAGDLPLVESTAWSVALPLNGTSYGFGTLRLPGAGSRDEIRANANLISPAYFATVGLPLVAGRSFTATDISGTPLVAIVNETFARHVWPGRDPLGQILINQDNQPVTVVGVARDAKYASAGESPRNFVYHPIAQRHNSRFNLLVRSRDGASLAPLLRELVRQLQPGLPITEIQSLEAVAATGLLPFRIAGAVAAGVGALALLLSATGVYGATLFWASTRTREFGLRSALGATFHQLVTFALRGCLRTLAVATALGLGCALALAQLASAALTKVTPDPFVLGGTTALFAVLVIVAAWLPARRAARVDPMASLRAE